MKLRSITAAAAIGIATVLPAIAQDGPANVKPAAARQLPGEGPLHGSRTRIAAGLANAAADIAPSLTFTHAQYATGGIALRNRAAGGISVSGVATPVKAAYLYWAVITNGATTAPDQSMYLTRLAPGGVPATLSLNGAVIGTGPTPCWPACNDASYVITVFRAAVPLSLATGNGLYQVTLLPGAAGDTNGADPESVADFPLMEGASLVIIGTGTQTVALYDQNLAGTLFFSNPGLSYTLSLPVSSFGTAARLDTIGADGQGYFGPKTTTINGVAIAGPGSQATDGDWDGRAGLPAPQLWDDAGHDITAAAPPGTTALQVNIATASGDDALTMIANIVAAAGRTLPAP